MTCQREIIYLYLEGELSAPEWAHMEAHLRQCEACAQRLQAQQAVLNELDGLSAITTPAGFDQQIIARAYEDLTMTFSSRAERRRALWAVESLTAATIMLLSSHTVTAYSARFLLGLGIIGRLLWAIAGHILKALSFVIASSPLLAGTTLIVPLLTIHILAILILIRARRMVPCDVLANER